MRGAGLWLLLPVFAGCTAKVIKLNPITGLQQQTCAVQGDCQAPLLCQNGFCVHGCTNTKECDTGQVCNATNLCVAPVIIKGNGEACATNNQCAKGDHCEATKCIV